MAAAWLVAVWPWQELSSFDAASPSLVPTLLGLRAPRTPSCQSRSAALVLRGCHRAVELSRRLWIFCPCLWQEQSPLQSGFKCIFFLFFSFFFFIGYFNFLI